MVLHDEDNWFHATKTNGFTGRKKSADLICQGAGGIFVMNVTLPNRNVLQTELQELKCKDTVDAVQSMQAHKR